MSKIKVQAKVLAKTKAKEVAGWAKQKAAKTLAQKQSKAKRRKANFQSSEQRVEESGERRGCLAYLPNTPEPRHQNLTVPRLGCRLGLGRGRIKSMLMSSSGRNAQQRVKDCV